jgi:hypothetical protein
LRNRKPHILSLARGERIKPTGLDWPKFIVAVDDGKVIGTVQLRKHPDVAAPPVVCLNYWLGYLGGRLIAMLHGRAVNHLAVFERSAPRSAARDA